MELRNGLRSHGSQCVRNGDGVKYVRQTHTCNSPSLCLKKFDFFFGIPLHIRLTVFEEMKCAPSVMRMHLLLCLRISKLIIASKVFLFIFGFVVNRQRVKCHITMNNEL